MAPSARAEAGFTLIELLVTMTILAIIMVALGAALFVGIRSTNDTETSLRQSDSEQALADWLNRDVRAAAGSTPTVDPGAPSTCGISPATAKVSIAYFATNALDSAPDTTAVYSVEPDLSLANRWNVVRTTCGAQSSRRILVRGVAPDGFVATRNPPSSDVCSAPVPAVALKVRVTLVASTQTDGAGLPTVPEYPFTLCTLRRAA